MSEGIMAPRDWATRVRPIAAATVRLLMAIFLAYLFVVVLMTASAQSEVAAKLSAIDKAPDYSSSYVLLTDANKAKRTLENQAQDKARLVQAETRSSEANNRASDGFFDLAFGLRNVMTAMNEKGFCSLPKVDDLRPGTVGSILDSIAQCDMADVPAGLKRDALALPADKAKLIAAGKDWQAAYNIWQGDKRTLTDFQAETTRLTELDGQAKDVRAAFAPISVLQDRWMLGGGLLVPFPPAMMQIIMAFFSGLFGALLVTLVLIVYPNTALGISTPGGNYGERILLGGLIAVCVFIVMGGGTAVLGTSNAFADGSANFQAFSAIGILAGMFSDRVAHWLSVRASNFYGDRADGSDSIALRPAPTPPPTPAPVTLESTLPPTPEPTPEPTPPSIPEPTPTPTPEPTPEPTPPPTPEPS